MAEPGGKSAHPSKLWDKRWYKRKTGVVGARCCKGSPFVAIQGAFRQFSPIRGHRSDNLGARIARSGRIAWQSSRQTAVESLQPASQSSAADCGPAYRYQLTRAIESGRFAIGRCWLRPGAVVHPWRRRWAEVIVRIACGPVWHRHIPRGIDGRRVSSVRETWVVCGVMS